ncbi:hypothetical protein [Streptomyces griseoluteus]
MTPMTRVCQKMYRSPFADMPDSSRTARLSQQDNYFGRHACAGRRGGTAL